MPATFAIARGFATRLGGLLGLAALTLAAPAGAEEQVLKFRLVVQPLGAASALPEIGGHKLHAAEHMGVAVFEDGRIAHKQFVDVSDDTTDSGTYRGYSTYTFQNGDSLTLSYTGGWDASGGTGVYELISGTGQFANASGTGSFKSVKEPWEQASLLEGEFRLNLATQ